MMTSEERAQNTFRSLATEAINEIMDALDTMGNFAPLHKNEMYGPEVDEAFKAIEDYVALTKAKYEPDKKRTKFRFKSEQTKQNEFGMKPIVAAREGGKKHDRRQIGLWEDGEYVGAFDNLNAIAGLLGCSPKNVDHGIKTERTIKGKYKVRRLDPEEILDLETAKTHEEGGTED